MQTIPGINKTFVKMFLKFFFNQATGHPDVNVTCMLRKAWVRLWLTRRSVVWCPAPPICTPKCPLARNWTPNWPWHWKVLFKFRLFTIYTWLSFYSCEDSDHLFKGRYVMDKNPHLLIWNVVSWGTCWALGQVWTLLSVVEVHSLAPYSHFNL